MALLLIDFKYLYGRNNSLVVKELAVVDPHNDRVSLFKFKSPYALHELPSFVRRLNTGINNGCNWNDGDIPHSEFESVLRTETMSASILYCLGSHKAELIKRITNCRVVDVSRVECSGLIRILCTFTCHNRFNYCCYVY
jgi:hypothetical protein